MNKNILWIIIGIVVIAIAIYFFVGFPLTTQKIGEGKGVIVEGYKDITPKQAKELIDSNPNLIIIDVSSNYNEGHIPGAINYYIGDGSLDNAIPTLDKTATYLVYCHVSSASRLGAQKLIDAEIENVYRLLGDYSAWVDADYEIE